MSEHESARIDSETVKLLTLRFFFGSLLLLAVGGYIGGNSLILAVEEAYPGHDIAKKWASDSILSSLNSSQVRSDTGSGALGSLEEDGFSVNESETTITHAGEVFGVPVVCANINTDDWGFPDHYDHNKPEVRTASEAIEAIAEVIGYLGDKVIVRQGDSIRVLNTHDESLGKIANETELCQAESQ